MGDFNTIMLKHEHRANHSPSIIAMEDFKNQTNVGDQIHLPTGV